MRMYDSSFRRDRRGLEIAMNMVVTIIVAVLVLGIVIAFITLNPPPVDKNMKLTYELTDSYGTKVNSLKSGNSSINLTITLLDTNGKPITGATVQLSGCQVSMVLEEKGNGKYINPAGSPLKPMLGPNDINGKINIIANAQDKTEKTMTILVIP